MLSGNAGEAETIHSEDEPISEVIVGSEPVKNVLTDSDAEAANSDVAIALKVAYAIFEGSCSATNQQLHTESTCKHQLQKLSRRRKTTNFKNICSVMGRELAAFFS